MSAYGFEPRVVWDEEKNRLMEIIDDDYKVPYRDYNWQDNW